MLRKTVTEEAEKKSKKTLEADLRKDMQVENRVHIDQVQ